jgi:flagellar protein FlbT
VGGNFSHPPTALTDQRLQLTDSFNRPTALTERKTRMSGLVLELRPGEAMIINGALVRFRTRSRIELVAKARFMFGKQIMTPEQADSPARRIYFALQSAYVGEGEEREAGLAAVHELIAAFKAATTSPLAREILDRAEAAALADDCYFALKLTRRIISHEDTVLGRTSPVAVPYEPGKPSRISERINEAHA